MADVNYADETIDGLMVYFTRCWVDEPLRWRAMIKQISQKTSATHLLVWQLLMRLI